MHLNCGGAKSFWPVRARIGESLRQQGEVIDDETLSHISLLPYRHVLPNGTYFIDDL